MVDSLEQKTQGNHVRTQAELADAVGLSQVTVQRALANHPSVRDATRRRVEEAVRKYGYRPNAAARMMRTRKSKQIGVMFRNALDRPLTNLSAFEVLLGVNQELEKAGYLVNVVRIADVDAEATDAIEARVFREQLLDGIIAVGQFPESIVEKVEDLLPHVVWVESQVWRPRNCIRRDEVYHGHLVTNKLIEAGFKRLVWVGRVREKSHHFSEDDRYLGVCQAAHEHGLAVEHFDLPVDLHGEPIDIKTLEKFVTPGTGLITYDSVRAREISFLSHVIGRRIGADIGMVSCENTYIDATSWPGLSCVHADRFEMGVEAAKLIGAAMSDEDAPCVSKLIRGEWRAGYTCGALSVDGEGGASCIPPNCGLLSS